MKRRSSDQDMDMLSPTAKKICLENQTDDAPADLDTPIDDAEDFYSDSPVMGQQEIKDVPKLAAINVPQSPPESLQNQNGHLPGLGLYQPALSNSPELSKGTQEGVEPEITSLAQSNMALQTEIPSASSLQKGKVAADDAYEIEENSQFEHVMNKGSSGGNLPNTANVTGERRMVESLANSWQPNEVQAHSALNMMGMHKGSDEQGTANGATNHTELPKLHETDVKTDGPIILDTVGAQDGLQQPETGDMHAQRKQRPSDVHLASDHSVTTIEDHPELNKESSSLSHAEHQALEMDAESSEKQPLGISNMISRAVEEPLTFVERKDEQNDGSNTRASELHSLEQNDKSNVTASVDAQTFEDVAEANKNDEGAEFELDSSPIELSSDSGTESSSSSSGASDYEMLDPEEEARRLMQEDGGSDDEGKGGKTTSGPLRTFNEKPDEVVPMPKIEVTPSMAIIELGNVEHVVENSILIKAKTSGERQALESGSLLCLEDRSVLGVIAETLGQVHQPYYSVRFTNATAIAEAGLFKGTLVFYVEKHASYVFTQNLKAFKGSDASNIHDEEVGDDELEFSDDEAEAEHKRRAKQERQAKRGGRADRGEGYSRGPGGGRVRRGGTANQMDRRNMEPPPENAPISYDDHDDGEDLYTPLTRPTNLHEAMGHREAPQEDLNHRLNGPEGGYAPRRSRPDRGRGRGDHRRGGRGGRGDRRGGGFNRDNGNGEYNNQNHHQQPQSYERPPTNHEQSFPNPNTTYQPAPPYAWPNSYPSNYNNPPNQPPYHQPAPFQQQQPYGDQGRSPYQYPHIQTPQPYGYPTQQNPHQNFPPHPAPSPAPANIPPGAHINPAFFSPAKLQPPVPQQTWQQQQQNTYGNPPQAGGSRSPTSASAYNAAQEKLNLLRQLSRGGGGSPS
ncbi:MAG: hypothetical protein Q9219_003992 [cf. Caloplaca sp. 3 TL-2023]